MRFRSEFSKLWPDYLLILVLICSGGMRWPHQMNGKTIFIKEQLYLGKMIVCLALSYVKSKQAKKKKKYVYIFLLDFKTFLNNLYNERSVLM